MTGASVVEGVCAVAAVLVMTVALGCADQRAATTGDGSAAGGDGFLRAANTACLQARAGTAQTTEPSAARDSSSPQGRRMRAHARQSLPVATRTLAVLQTLRPSGETREALARLESEYQRLNMVYAEAAAPGRRHTKALAAAVGSAEASVRAQARAARLPACSP